MRTWNIGDKVVLVDDDGMHKLLEGTIVEVVTEDNVPYYRVRKTDAYPEDTNIYGIFRGEDLVTPEKWAADQPLMLGSLTAKRCEDGSILVTSDLDQKGWEVHFNSVNEEIDERQFLYAITEFLGFDPDSVLCLPELE